MARVYMITEPEMQGLLDQLEMTSMIDKNFMIGEAEVTADEVNKLAQHIQDEIETWLTGRDPELVAKLAARTT